MQDVLVTAVRPARTKRGVRLGVGGFMLQLFFVSGVLLIIGCFSMYLTGVDPDVERPLDAGSAISQTLLGALYLIAAIVFARAPHAGQILARSWPIVLLPVLGLVSALWSLDPALTTRRAFALLGTIVFGLSLASVYAIEGVLKTVVNALAIAMALSVVWALAAPAYGLHQAGDAVEAIHAGRWRGVFAHKNVLGGQVASLTLPLVMLYGRYAFKSWLVWMAAIAVSVACLYFASSGAGFVLAALVAGFGFTLVFLARQTHTWRMVLLMLLFGVGTVLCGFLPTLADAVLALLGKDPDLTGRTLVWTYALDQMADHWVLGYGLYAGYVGLYSSNDEAGFSGWGGTHNGYLDLLVSFGFVGLVIGVLCLAWLLARAAVKFLNARKTPGALHTFPLCVVVFVIAHNFVETSLLSGNTLVPMMLAIAAGAIARGEVDARRSRTIAPRAAQALR